MISNNEALYGGGIISWYEAALYISNTTFVGNVADTDGPALNLYNDTNVNIINSIIWDCGTIPIYRDPDSVLSINYSML